METPAAKRSRLEAIRQRVPYVSQRALAAILGEASRAPLPRVARRQEVRRARDDLFEQLTPYGLLVQNFKLRRTAGGLDATS